MAYYKRYSNDGHEIVFDPEDEQAAAETVAECPDTNVETPQEAHDSDPVEVDDETAEKIREIYHEKAVPTGPQENR